MGHLFVILALGLFGAIAFCTAFFPHVMPRLTNSYYSLIGMKTRVAEEDYSKLGPRLAGGLMLVTEIAWIWLRLSRQ
jgi:hypothetical protein